MAQLTYLIRRIAAAAALLVISNIVGCDSSLSDVDITDPSLIQANFLVQQTSTKAGTANAITATLLDKNIACIKLKDGKVTVNNQDLAIVTVVACSTYTLNNAAIAVNTLYQFNAILANGKSYGGSVTTPQQVFSNLTVPASANAQNDIPISWTSATVYDELKVKLTFTVANNLVDGPYYLLTTAQMTAGSFTIPKASLSSQSGITKVTISLEGTTTGSVDSKFRSGSSTKSIMKISRDVPVS